MDKSDSVSVDRLKHVYSSVPVDLLSLHLKDGLD